MLHELLYIIPIFGSKENYTHRKKRKAHDTEEHPVVTPLRLKTLFTEDELIEGSKPKVEETTKKTKKKSQARPKPKKTKFGRVGEAGDGDGAGGLVDDDE